MSNNQADFELIERFYIGDLSDTEAADFAQRRQTDAQFEAEVQDYLALMEGIETAALKAQLDDYHQGISKETNNLKLNFKRLSIAAAVILGVTILAFLLLKPSEPEVLFAKYFEPDPGLPTLMSQTNDQEYQFQNGMVAYKQGDYDKALNNWEKLEDKNTNDTIGYFIGVAKLADGDDEGAITYLLPLAEKESQSFSSETYHYLALAYLKNGQTELAKKYLNLSSLEASKQLLEELK